MKNLNLPNIPVFVLSTLIACRIMIQASIHSLFPSSLAVAGSSPRDKAQVSHSSGTSSSSSWGYICIPKQAEKQLVYPMSLVCHRLDLVACSLTHQLTLFSSYGGNHFYSLNPWSLAFVHKKMVNGLWLMATDEMVIPWQLHASVQNSMPQLQ